ncbi:uncharacterized protein LOC113352323 [Papaver somniferum]|uniref:uncharacterized protein LOC113352323 n=1 Tax=Papaver somniferum TaxID=3469 RepID=UPI000E70333D|nr:uncharacterized protein LOC113352323 [Papaver somniferum]
MIPIETISSAERRVKKEKDALTGRVHKLNLLEEDGALSRQQLEERIHCKVKLRGIETMEDEVNSCMENLSFPKNKEEDKYLLEREFTETEILKAKKPGFLCKLDMEKAFDNVNWHSLFLILEKHEFGVKWISWIKWCVTSSLLSVLVNDSSTEKFKPSKGLRQGDP